MKRLYWAGYITPNVILQHANIATWALHWLTRAEKSEREGKELLVFEVPKNGLLSTIEGIEDLLQNELQQLQIPAGDDQGMPLDMFFINAIMMPPDDV